MKINKETTETLVKSGVSAEIIQFYGTVFEGREFYQLEDYVMLDGHLIPKQVNLFLPKFWDYVKLLSWTNENSQITAFADGSGTTNGKDCGIGVYLEKEGDFHFVSKYAGLGTNNVAELSAIYAVLMHITAYDANLLICSDSEYAIGSVTEDWNAKVNIELIQLIKNNLKYRKNIKFKHVRGHVGVTGNEISDTLAKMARRYKL